LGEETIVGMTFQSTGVKKSLAAVWRVCEKGNVIQFGDEAEDCFIKNKKSGRKIFMRKKKCSYVLDVEFVLKRGGETISLGKMKSRSTVPQRSRCARMIGEVRSH
jgi:hypothetical protein